MRVFLIGYPGEMGGANTEAWHTLQLWRRMGLDVHVIPTWQADPKWKARLDALGYTTHLTSPEDLDRVPGLAGSPVVGLCNSQFITLAPRFRALGCPIVWVNCMTFLFDGEKEFYKQHGPADAMVYQSQFQRDELEPQLAPFGYRSETGHLIRGAFDLDGWNCDPRSHGRDEAFFIGRVARPDLDKWSSNTLAIYERIQYRSKRGIFLGVDERTQGKLGSPPWWVDYLRPMAISAQDFYSRLHCLLPVNGGARENWPRAGLEAMASGVPVVAQNEWGWREMVIHGETGFLGSDDYELAHWAGVLAHDESLRLRMVRRAYEHLCDDLANPDRICADWQSLFESVTSRRSLHLQEAAA
jgi:glycosyltransferase involved in cell wall biosynthesis